MRGLTVISRVITTSLMVMAVELGVMGSNWPQAIAAEYQGRTIDGHRFVGTAYSYETGGVFDVEVEFRDNRATLHFANGGQKTIRLRNPVITNPQRIEGSNQGFVTLGGIFSLGVADHHAGNLEPPRPRPFQGFWRIQLSEAALDLQDSGLPE